MTLTTLLHEFIPHSRAVAPERKAPSHHRSVTTTVTDNSEMISLAKSIIRQQWQHRNASNPKTRRQARSLIKTHLVLLRLWIDEASSRPQLHR